MASNPPATWFSGLMTDTPDTKNADYAVRYEVQRQRGLTNHAKTSHRAPLVETFYGLDRARLAALGWALDGQTVTGELFSGIVEIFEVAYASSKEVRRQLIDRIDERVAHRLLNELRFPKAEDMSYSLARLEAEVDHIASL